ncbi:MULTISPECIES: hypothetical protein [unclassified Microbacterium]|uniref:hypothetical protein n=1 Tax=unclassified Microbacterium TaxID=2609290 RepID=UPI00214B4769|nr:MULTISPECIES: hypothetical protein [unclassified Microbacterium]MCR2808885.1 hypothetical protein [Microbacterium sp. zg.B185]WIM18696.1 hypothetical protein QNO12_14040 [Microbacterium sp. zg-B185]
MPPDINRRSLFRGSLILATAGVLASCSALPAPRPTPSHTAAPTPAPVPSASRRPATTRSYGPNGTHYPEDLPWLGDTAALELVAECDWIDIARKVEALDAPTVAAGVIIRVKPGTLPGGGAGSSARPVLAGVGNAGWARNVLICPLEGFGSVTTAAGGIRFDQCARLSFFGFQSAGTVTMTRCVGLQLGWSRFDGMNITRGARDIALYELVLGFRQSADDTAGIRPTEAFEMTNFTRHGCVFGPSVKPDGSDAHCDTIQLEGTGTGPFGPFLSVDCVDYGSSNAAELLHTRLVLADYQHCMILGGQLPWRVFPLRSGDYEGDPNAFAGGCQDVRLTDCVVVGAIGRMGFTQVHSSTLSYNPVSEQQPRDSGSWDVDGDSRDWNRDEIMARQSIPDYEIDTLRSIWAW